MNEHLDPLLAETALGPQIGGDEPPSSPFAGAAPLGTRIMLFLRVRVLPVIITLLIISIIVFAATHLLGIDQGRRALGRQASAAQLEEFNRSRGLDRPIYVQYGSWLAGFVQGDWGTSAISDRRVFDVVAPRIMYTLILALAAIVIAIPLSIAFGVYLARPGNRAKELSLSIASVSLAAVPVFVIGIVLIYVFSVQLGWTPVDSSALSFGTPIEKVAAFILPTAALVLSLLPHISRLTQVSVRETMAEPYARAAVLRGLARRTITMKHLLPNAAGPIINVVALDLIWLVGGVIIVENVFGFPGLGTLLVESIGTGDLIVVQAVAVLTGAMFIAISLMADVLVVVFNPRLRGG